MDASFYEQLGTRVAKFRLARSLSQERLAERAGLSSSYLAHVEGGSRRPTLDALGKIAQALEVPIWRLIADDRLTPSEEEWRGAVATLRATVQSLSKEDIDLLVAVAQRFRKAPPAVPARSRRRT